MTQRWVLASRNRHKVAELHRILTETGLDVELVGVDEFPGVPDVPETGSTFAENALLKAHAVALATSLPAVADDSGLCVDALKRDAGHLLGAMGGRHGDDDANLSLVLGQLSDVPTSDVARSSFALRRWLVPTARGSRRGRTIGAVDLGASGQTRLRLRPDLRPGRRESYDCRNDCRGEGRHQSPGQSLSGVSGEVLADGCPAWTPRSCPSGSDGRGLRRSLGWLPSSYGCRSSPSCCGRSGFGP